VDVGVEKSADVVEFPKSNENIVNILQAALADRSN